MRIAQSTGIKLEIAPKDLAAAIAVEVGELHELFLWKSSSADMEVLEHRRSEVEEELADIAIFLLSLADVAGIDLAEAVQQSSKKKQKMRCATR